MKDKPKPKLRAPQYTGYYLKIRTYDDTPFVSVWIIGKNGSLRSGLMNGTLMADEADRLAKVLKLKVLREKEAYTMTKPQRENSQAMVNEGLFALMGKKK